MPPLRVSTSMRSSLPSRMSGFWPLPSRRAVAAAATVAGADVEHAVGAELELAAVVVALGIIDLHQLALPRADARRALLGAQLPDRLVALLVGEVDVELAVARELRVERDREQTALAAGLDEALEVRVRPRRDLAVRHRADRPRLLDHEQPLVPGRRGHVDGRAQPGRDLGQGERLGTRSLGRARCGRDGCHRACERGQGERDPDLHSPQRTRDPGYLGAWRARRNGPRRARVDRCPLTGAAAHTDVAGVFAY